MVRPNISPAPPDAATGKIHVVTHQHCCKRANAKKAPRAGHLSKIFNDLSCLLFQLQTTKTLVEACNATTFSDLARTTSPSWV